MKLTRGSELNAKARTEVLRRYTHRFTGEHRPEWSRKPMPNGDAYKPTHATDAEWIDAHAFWIRRDGGLALNRHHAEPEYMATKG